MNLTQLSELEAQEHRKIRLEMNEPKTKMIHIRKRKKDGSFDLRGGVTILYCVEDGKICFTLAECSVSDNFNKKIGRFIALGRYIKYNWDFVSIFEPELGNLENIYYCLTKQHVYGKSKVLKYIRKYLENKTGSDIYY